MSGISCHNKSFWLTILKAMLSAGRFINISQANISSIEESNLKRLEIFRLLLVVITKTGKCLEVSPVCGSSYFVDSV